MEQANVKTYVNNLVQLVDAIQKANQFFLNQVQKQVNTSMTLRNWIIGYYIVEYEQGGQDRAEYGEKLYRRIANTLKGGGLGSIRERHLYLCKDFYLAYPNILRTPSAKLYLTGFQDDGILQTLSAKSITEGKQESGKQVDSSLLLTRLSFSHFIELIKVDTSLKRSFYEVQAIKNNWSVRILKRAINSMQYERTGLSKDKKAVMEEKVKVAEAKPEDVLRNPYVLEFLGLDEKPSYTETDLEAAIITHLQTFLLEMGWGFCFEARQKRITFDNTHYRIDLVFYHRILKCHVLLELKMEDFTHADAGQMNVYLNYYKENETQEDDNPPIGIILCAGKDEALVKYATMGLPQKVFVSKYLVNLPTELELQKVINEEREKLKA
jgi:predicted nuclease of restriction endonuclease-like (RecB) superfamily